MKILFTLTNAESRRMIAKGVAMLPEVRQAWENAYVILAGGTTNGMVLQELTGDYSYSPEKCTIGTNVDGVLCLTQPKDRQPFPTVFYQGEASRESIPAALGHGNRQSVVIKGANAIDAGGTAGVLVFGANGGTVNSFIGSVIGQGLSLIVPVGLEKLVPSVREAAEFLRQEPTDISLGCPVQLYPLPVGKIFTEIEAIKLLFNLKARLIAAGGTGGSQGSVILCASGEKEQVLALKTFLDEIIKGEPPIPGGPRPCKDCRIEGCDYKGKPS